LTVSTFLGKIQLASNLPQQHWSKAFVVSVEGKGVPDTSGMDQEGEHP